MATVNINGNMQIGAGAITDQQVASNAAIAVTKLQHAYYRETNFGLKIADTPVTSEYVVHQANSAGTVRSFSAMCSIAPASGSVTFDLKKNGVSILVGVITIDNTISNGQAEAGNIASATYLAGDRLSIACTFNAGTGAQGPLASAGLSETSAP